jgi:hypothetical protein
MGVNGHWYVEITKQAFWRGAPHTFQNRYIMSGAQPSASDAATVITALKDIEDGLFPGAAPAHGVGFVRGSAYGSGSGAPFQVTEYNASEGAGTATGFTGPGWGTPTIVFAPTLETCLMVETPITGLSSTGKPVRLRKYFRGIASGADEPQSTGQVAAGDITGVNALVLPWKTGMGASNWVVIAPSGAQASAAPVCYPYLVAHQIPRGRKKASSSGGSDLSLGSLLRDGLTAAQAAAIISVAAG